MKRNVSERPWTAWACVLLAALILYNPFAALGSSSNTIAVRGMARHRATVGASELQHLAPSQEQTQQPDVELQEAREGMAVPVVEQPAQPFESDVEVPQPEFGSRVWSRPPPLV